MSKKPNKTHNNNESSLLNHNTVQSDNNNKKNSLFADKIKPISEFIAIILGVIFGLISIYYVGKQINDQNVWNKKDATFRYLDEYTESLRNTTDNLSTLLQTDSIEIVFLDKEQKVKIMNLVGYFENLAIGIENNYFDENIAISSLYRQALIVYDELTKHRYFTVREQEVGRPTAKNFRKLAGKWKQE